MFDQIRHSLEQRKDLRAWSLRQVHTRGAQLYAVPSNLEADRQVSEERYLLMVQVDSGESLEKPACGDGNITLLPGDNIEAAIDMAALIARQVHNPPYSYPGPQETPQVALADPAVGADLAGALEQVFDRLRRAVAAQAGVRLTAAEGFSQQEQVRFANSLGIDCEQAATRIDVEFVLNSQKDGRQAEAFCELTRRRMADLDLEAEVERSARQARELLDARPPQDYAGPVVLQGQALAEFLSGNVLRTLSSAQAKFGKYTPWEPGKPVLRGEVKGDPLTVWANRRLPFGTHAGRFDEEGLPGQRLLLIENGRLANYWAQKRHADYLSLPVTGSYGDVELPPGVTPAAGLLSGAYIEIVQFSQFDADSITGEFASEIRFGYRVQDGQRTPLRGGMLVGGMLEALANVRWSAETGFFGSYQGPVAARFEDLRISAG
jgi:predicted Zn-dependent protease